MSFVARPCRPPWWPMGPPWASWSDPAGRISEWFRDFGDLEDCLQKEWKIRGKKWWKIEKMWEKFRNHDCPFTLNHVGGWKPGFQIDFSRNVSFCLVRLTYLGDHLKPRWSQGLALGWHLSMRILRGNSKDSKMVDVQNSHCLSGVKLQTKARLQVARCDVTPARGPSVAVAAQSDSLQRRGECLCQRMPESLATRGADLFIYKCVYLQRVAANSHKSITRMTIAYIYIYYNCYTYTTNTHIHTYIHAYIHTYIYMYTYIDILICVCDCICVSM